MDTIKEIVGKVIGDISIQKQNDNPKILALWQKILREDEAKHCRISGCKKGVLVIWVDSPAWLYQFKTNYKRLFDLMKKGVPDLKEIVFKIGKVK